MFCPYKKGTLQLAHSLCHVREDTTKRQPSAGQERRPHQEPTLLDLDLGTSSFQKCEKINFCCVSHPVCGILLQQPKQIKTGSKHNPMHHYKYSMRVSSFPWLWLFPVNSLRFDSQKKKKIWQQNFSENGLTICRSKIADFQIRVRNLDKNFKTSLNCNCS